MDPSLLTQMVLVVEKNLFMKVRVKWGDVCMVILKSMRFNFNTITVLVADFLKGLALWLLWLSEK